MKNDITFVTVIESGRIERNVIRLIKSLRSFGGSMADAPFIFVKPRPGPKLDRQTFREMDKHDVLYRQCKSIGKYEWYNFINKPLALIEAMKIVTTPVLCWIDDDFLIFDELPLLLLGKDADFAASPSDLNMGSTGPGSRYESYWQEFCKAVQFSIEELGWIQIHKEKIMARTYFNGGMFSFRTSTDFANDYLRTVLMALDANIKSSTDGVFTHEQMSLGISARRLNMRIHSLPWTYNFSNYDLFEEDAIHEKLLALHHHGAFWPSNFNRHLQRIKLFRPDRVDFISSLGPLSVADFDVLKRLSLRYYGWRHRLKHDKYLAGCRVIDTASKAPQ